MSTITVYELMKKVGVKQKDLSELLGVHESTISLKLSGKRIVTLQEAKVISKKLKVTTDALFYALDFAKRKVDGDNPDSAA